MMDDGMWHQLQDAKAKNIELERQNVRLMVRLEALQNRCESLRAHVASLKMPAGPKEPGYMRDVIERRWPDIRISNIYGDGGTPFFLLAAYLEIEEICDQAGIPITHDDGEPHYLATRVKMLKGDTPCEPSPS